MSGEDIQQAESGDEAGQHKGYQQAPRPLTDAERRTLMQLDLERGRSDSKASRLGCLLKTIVLLAVLCTPVVAFFIIQPWETRSEQTPINSDLCTEDEQAMMFRERFFVLGFEVSSKHKGVVCVTPTDP
jgi:hypothetical protein